MRWERAHPGAHATRLAISFLLAGAIIVETVFGLPGIGRLIFQATAQRDLMVVRSVVLVLVAQS